MSLAFDKVPVTLVEDSRLTFPEWTLPARFGGSAMNYSQQTCNGLPGAGGGPVSFTIRTNNPAGAVIAPTLIWYTECKFTITGVAANTAAGLFNPGSGDAPRAYPYTSCCDNQKLEINGQSIDFQSLSMVGHVLRRFNPRAAMYKAANFCPWYPDSGCTNYSDLRLTNRNPLGSGGVGDFDFTRGCYQQVVYENGIRPGAGGDPANPATSGTVVLKSWEPVNISPLIYDMQGKGIPYIETLNLTFYLSNLHRALSRATYTSGGAVTAQILPANVSTEVRASTLFYQQINLPLWAREISPVVKFPFYKIRAQPCQIDVVDNGVPALGTVPAGKSVSSQIINFDNIPSRIYVFAQPSVEKLTMQDADFTFMYCSGLQVTWGNNTFMSSVLPQQLYTSAVDAGYAFPWENFAGSYMMTQTVDGVSTAATIGSSGSVICLRPGIDFPLNPGEAVGMGGQYSFQVQANFHDQRATGAAPSVGQKGQLWVVAVSPGVFTISSDGSCNFATGVINKNDLADAADKEIGDRVEGKDIYNSFGSGMFDSLQSSLPILKRLGRYAHAGLSAAKDAGLLGEGVTSGGSSMSGGAASMYGGARLPQSTIASLASRHHR